MFNRNRIALAISLGTALSLIVGCGAGNAPGTAPSDSEELSSAPVAAQLKVEGEQPAKEVSPSDQVVPGNEDQQATEKPETLAYDPPFPDRVDLFVAPKRNGRGIAATPEGVERAVELIGFVNVDSQQVVLSIDGKVTPLGVGSQIAEIEVISIQPPVVVLQRGRQRWRATLEN
ncbi:MAG: hypothetical protein GXP26_15370 [Planctomycetes bacterium]|nr:hypothetical protein [Planctomycetota bacterium]